MAAALTFKSRLQELFPQIEWMVGLTDGCLNVSGTHPKTGKCASSLVAESICLAAQAGGTFDDLVRETGRGLIAKVG